MTLSFDFREEFSSTVLSSYGGFSCLWGIVWNNDVTFLFPFFVVVYKLQMKSKVMVLGRR